MTRNKHPRRGEAGHNNPHTPHTSHIEQQRTSKIVGRKKSFIRTRQAAEQTKKNDEWMAQNVKTVMQNV